MSVSTTTIALDRFSTFGDLLKYLRRRAGYTQRELSIAVGYSDTQISRLEHNERLPDLATLTARFLPVLDLEDEPEVTARLLELAATVRREDAPAPGLPPYKGLHYFDEADAELFFGREALTARLLARVTERAGSGARFLAIVGASGSGKSSVVRAGLIPALRWQPPSSGWPIFVMTPTSHPLEALATALGGEGQLSLPQRTLADELAGNPEMLHETLARLISGKNGAQALLVVDQFEELFTLCRGEAEQDAFVDNLMAAAFAPEAPGLVVLVLRADFYSHCARFDHLRPALAEHQEYIGAMTSDELRCAIEEPARQGHWAFEPGLAELLLHDVGADAGRQPEPGALPLLSHALLATWQRRRGRLLTHSGYMASGGVRGAIAETAEAVFYDQLDREQRQIARHIFVRLTELGGDASMADTRRRVSIDELVTKPEQRQNVHEVLSALADARLVTTDENAAEVAHEALIREWPTLRGWLEEDREGLRLHRHLTEAAQEWDALGRDPGSLYRGARLAQATEWMAAHPEAVNVQERAFLDSSQALAESEEREREAHRQRELEAARQLAEAERVRAGEEEHANQRLRRRAALLAIVLVIASGLVLAATIFARRATEAELLATSRALAAAAVTNLEIDAERSALLALEALDRADTLEARNALRQAVPGLHLLYAHVAHDGGAPDVAISPDGALVASLGNYGEVKLWAAASGAFVRTLDTEPGEFGNSIAFSPDSRLLAVGWPTKVTLWDISSGERLLVLSGESFGTTIGYNLGTGQLSFSPDGRRLAVANMDGASVVWELETQAIVLSLAPEGLPAKAIAYNPDGTLLATGGDEGTVTVWDAESGEPRYTRPLGGIIHAVTFSYDGAVLAAASEDGSARVWQAATGADVATLPRTAGMYDIVFLADGRLATAGQDGVTRVWDAGSGQQLMALSAATSTVIGVAGSPDGRRIATGGYDGSVRVWDASPGHELLTLPAHGGIVWNVAYSPDGQRIASAGVDGLVKLWAADTGRQLLSFPAPPGPGFTGLAYSPDGSRLATGAVDGTVALWGSATGEQQRALAGHANMVVGLAFSPDGQRLASASWDGTAKVWDLASGAEVVTFTGHEMPGGLTNIAFSPDGRYAFTSGDDDVARQWDARSGEEIRVFSGEERDIYGLALSLDGATLALGDQDGGILIYEVSSGERLHKLSGHAGLLLRMAFYAGGSLLASTGFDRLAKVWDVASGEELFSLYGNSSNVFGVAFSPDGSQLATAGADGTVRTYALSLDEVRALAEARLTRSLTDAECAQFLHVTRCP
jgi:WD40 repeat protein/transcriptional regulator with XRE-family HTH domain